MTPKTASSLSGTGLVIACSALIAGNLVGAGILGLPINTGLAGLWPSILAMLAGGGMMYLTAVILGEQAAGNPSENFDYPSLYEAFLGRVGKWAAIIANMIILYGLLTAYFTGGAKIAASLAGFENQQTMVTLFFALPLVVMTCINLSLIQRLNTFLVIFLAGTFALLVALSAGHVDTGRMSYADWVFLPATLPIIVTAFHFHNIIPTVSSQLNRDMSLFKKAVLLGMLMAFIMNGLWVLVGIGVIPLTGENSILTAWETNTPATIPMGVIMQSPLFTLMASLFALVAISTSFLANGLGLQGFLRDLLANTFGLNSRALVILTTFAPPLFISLIYPDIFLKALDIVGGVGIVILFGILPTLIVILDKARSGKMRLICLAALIFASSILVLELFQESGIMRLHPWVED